MRFKSIITKVVHKIRGEVDTGSLIKMGLKVGKNFNRQGGVIIDPAHCWLISIGDDVTLAARVYILAHDASTKQHLGFTKVGNVTIGNKVFIGANSTILPNVSIGSNVIIGAGSVVSKDIPDNCVAVGNPAKVVSTIEDYIQKNKQLMKNSAVFDTGWTVNGHITEDKKKTMHEKLSDGMGYVP